MTVPESPHPQIIFLGEPMVEFVRQGGPDSLDYRMGIGGDTSNAAIAAARQGVSVGYATAIGQDRFGDLLMAAWRREGIDTAQVLRDPGAPTGIYFVDPDPEARQFTYYRKGSAASRLTPERSLASVSQACFCHLTGITLGVSAELRATARAMIEEADAHAAHVSIDTNLRPALWPVEEARAAIHDAIGGFGGSTSGARFVTTSVEDAAQLAQRDDPVAIAAFYRDMGAQTVLVTLGAEGCLISDREAGDYHVPPFPATPVDSTGAGDSFVGSFLARMVLTADPVGSARYAAYVASCTVSGHGATAPIPYRAEVEEKLGLRG